jgi:hypothetical protein
MNKEILSEFLAFECDDYVKSLIRDAVQKSNLDKNLKVKKFEFDRFNITMDFENQVVLVEDVLDASEAGTGQFDLDEFCSQALGPGTAT